MTMNFIKFIKSLGESYPDINAVFFNRGNLLSDEKISDEEKQKYNAFLEISKQIPNRNLYRTFQNYRQINRDKFALTVPYRFEIFQDLFDENQRKE